VRWLIPLLLLGCASEETEGGAELDDSLFQDFLRDGKFDQAGHPVNAVTLEAERICQGTGTRLSKSFLAGKGEACRAPLEPRAFGELTLDVRLRATPARRGDLVTITISDGESELATRTLSQVRKAGVWMYASVPFSLTQGQSAEVRIAGAGNGRLEIDYLELFPTGFQLVIDPGSREYKSTDLLVFETSLSAPAVTVSADGVDVTPRLRQLLAAGVATQTTTSFRRVVSVPAGKLLSKLDAQILARSGDDVARVEVRSAPPAAEFDGDLEGQKVLLTGFQPFPADARHENISWVAVSSLDPLNVAGAQIMRLQLPVEYDRAAAEVTSAIERCRPDLVISFGQGGDAIHLEETAYNLKDTAEVAGGVPDNRGVVFAGQPIDVTAPDTRATGLGLDAIDAALRALDESPQRSDDPGRYICNNVFFAGVGAAESLGIPAGFVHLPYEDQFPDETRARWGRVVETIVQATLP